MKDLRNTVLFILIFLPFQTIAFTPSSLFLEGVIVKGNRQIPDHKVLEILKWNPEIEFSADSLAIGEERLLKSGYFKSVFLYTKKGSIAGYVIVIARIKEKRNPQYEFLRYSITEKGHNYDLISVKHNSQNGTKKEAHLGFRDEWFDVGVEIKNYFNKINTSYGLKYRYTTYDYPALSYNNGYMIQLGELIPFYNVCYDNIHFTFSHKAVFVADSVTGLIKGDNNFTITDRSILPDGIRKERDNNWVIFEISYLLDTRDRDILPSQGMVLYMPLYIATSLINKRSYAKSELGLRLYKKITRYSSYSCHLRSGISTNTTPYYERYHLGRNFNIRSLSPSIVDDMYGGTCFYYGSLDYHYIIRGNYSKPFLIGSLFAEFGANWNTEKYYDKDPDFKLPSFGIGTGVTFNFRTPGPLTIHIGMPLIKHDETKYHPSFHISLGFYY